MRLLLTGDTVGGVFTYVCELTRALVPHGVEVDVVLAGRQPTDDQRRRLRDSGAARIEVDERALEWMPDPWDDVERAGTRLLELAEELEPDVVHLNDYAHGALDWPAPVLVVGHSCVLSWHEAVRGVPAGREWDEYRERVTLGLRGADLVAAPTDAMRRELVRRYGPLRETAVVPNGRRAPDPASDAAREPFVLACGRFWDEAKNLFVLDRAAAALDVPVLVAGEAAPGGAPGSALLLGRLGADELEELYARAAVFAAPSTYEPFGLAALEAGLAGCALVLGDLPSLREVWGEAALYVDPRDHEALAAAVRVALAQPELGEAARERARAYTPERLARGYLELYERLTVAERPETALR